MAGVTLSNVDYVVKTVYKDGAPENLAARNHTLFSRIRKVGGFTGKQFDAPVTYSNPQLISNTYSTFATSTATGYDQGDRWNITRVKKYGKIEIDAETLHAIQGDDGAFVRQVKHSVDTMLMAWGDDAAFELYGAGNGVLARVNSSGLSGSVATLTEPDDTLKFEVGMACIFASATNGTTSAVTTTITAIDEDAGTITVNTTTGIAASDYIFRSGNIGSTSVTGLAAWIPDTAPSTSLFGINRALHKTRLGGHRVAATAVDLDEALLDLAARIHRRKGRPDSVYVSPTNFTTLVHKLGAKVEREAGGTATFGFQYIQMATPAGIVKVFSDPDCPSTNAYMLDHRVCYIKHLLGLPHIVNDDGLTMVRMTSEDSVEIRCRGFWQLVVEAPGYCGTVTGL